MYVNPRTWQTSTGYTSVNPKWRYAPGQLGYYRPNQAFARGIYPGLSKSAGAGLGQGTAVNLPLLAIGVGAFAVAMYLWGGKRAPQVRKKKIATLAARRARISQQLQQLESA